MTLRGLERTIAATFFCNSTLSSSSFISYLPFLFRSLVCLCSYRDRLAHRRLSRDFATNAAERDSLRLPCADTTRYTIQLACGNVCHIMTSCVTVDWQ